MFEQPIELSLVKTLLHCLTPNSNPLKLGFSMSGIVNLLEPWRHSIVNITTWLLCNFCMCHANVCDLSCDNTINM